MDATRCLDCGDVRWSLIGLKGQAGACEICGGETVPERRRPTAGPRPEMGERRDLVGVPDLADITFHPTA